LKREAAKKLTQMGEVRGRGLMIGIELVGDSKKTPAQRQAATVKGEMLRRGYLVGVGGIHKNVIRIQPPLVITSEEIESAAEALEKSIRASFS